MVSVCQRCNYENQEGAKFCLQCGAMLETVSAEPSDPLLGKVFLDRYRIVRVLGEGGMGKVYLAEQKMGTATRKVAIKTLHPELSSDPQLVARFHRECETVIELHHPNTVQFYDFGELENRTLFIVMEFIEGEDLARRLRRGPVDPQTADKLIIQICGSLHEAHGRGIVHRDLKPENVLLTSRGGQNDFVKVLDFGIAKRSEAEDESKAKLTKQGTVLGTPPYMSPEQFSGETLDLRSDIYSLGVMTYEMLTGQLPFSAKTPWEWATRHLTQMPTPLEAHPAGAALSLGKRNAIMRALTKRREERHADVLAFMQEFTGIADPGAAWTMATSLTNNGTPPAGRVPGTHATPVSAAPFAPVSQPGIPQASFASGQQYAAASGSYGSSSGSQQQWDSSAALPQKSNRGFIVGGFLAVLAVVGGGGAWWFSQRQDASGQLTPAVPVAHDPALVPTVLPPVGADVPTVQPTVEPTMVEPPPVDPVVEPPPTDPIDVATPTAMDEPENSTDAQAVPKLNAAESALGRNDLEAAISNLLAAQRVAGNGDRGVRRVRTAISQRGYNQVGLLVAANRCSEAQALFRKLRSVGAERRAREQFYGSCSTP